MNEQSDTLPAEAPPEHAGDGTETVEAYEVDDGVVLHDAENPFAWVEASRTVDLAEQT